tara:strand:- start:455 stop:1930 length:1476 start_codon:yes stop_codon:yes gene_type:complete
MAVQSQAWALSGGLDLISPALQLPPGKAILAQNYECHLAGGYRRIDGYTIYDGRSSGTPLAVTGSGPIRGVWEYNNVVYAFRDNAAGNACVMHKSTSSGWVVVTTPALLAGGSFDFVNHNFTGHSGSLKMFGCNGLNKAFQFNGTTLSFLTTGMTSDVPSHVGVHKNHLFLSFTGGSVQHSAVGNPASWTLVTGAGEIGIGTEITGFSSMKGNSLAITGVNQISILYGTSSSDWDLKLFSPAIGAVSRTNAQMDSDLYFFNGEDLSSLTATQAFGDFESASVSAVVKPFIDARKNSIVGATVNRDKNQYRLFFNDTTVLVGTIINRQIVGFSTWKLSHTASYVTEKYMGCTDGSIMLMDSGTSFNGTAIQSYLRLPFTNFNTPHRKKRFRKATLELEAGSQATLDYLADYNYGTGGSSSGSQTTVYGGGGFWDVANWDNFVWSSAVVSSAEAYLNGSGMNISLLIVHTSATDPAFTLQGVQLNYSLRGLNR